MRINHPTQQAVPWTHSAGLNRKVGTITKTYKGLLAPDGGSAADGQIGVFASDAQLILRGAQQFVDLGIDQLIVQLHAVHDLAAIRSAGECLAALRPSGDAA